MESNRDDSEKCFRFAMKSRALGDIDKAMKYAEKADRLYPTEKAKKLLSELQKEAADMASGASNGSMPNGGTEGYGAGAASEDDGLRRRRQSGSNDTASAEKAYTSEQAQACKKTLKCKDYYEILGVDKSCSDEDLKKAYRKLALKFHPDKNKAPGATDAFKAIGNAFAVLNDPEKRRRYDQYGLEEDTPQHHYHHRNDFTRGFEGDISPEELFNIFFGGGYPSGRVYTTGHRRGHRTFYREEAHSDQSGYSVLLQLAPILFLVALSLLSSFLSGDPVYQLNRSHKYVMERRTGNLHVPYYVKASFNEEYRGSIRRLEDQIEQEYISQLRNECFRERSYRESLLWRARNYQDAAMYERAQELKTPSCDRLQKIYS